MQEDYTMALDYYQRSLKICQEIGDKFISINTMYHNGKIYTDLGNYQKAVDYCKKSLSVSEEVGVLATEIDACQCSYDSYKAMGKGNEALVYLEKIQEINGSLIAEETAKKLQ
jgi:adenylate cyclase